MSELYLNPHQTRTAEPSPAENAIADVIERCYAEGVTEVEPIVAALLKDKVPHPDGAAWTVASFKQLMARLGA